MSRRRGLWLSLASVALFLVAGRAVAGAFAEYRWFDALGAADIWRLQVGQAATLRAVFAGVCLLAEPGTLRGRRFGNLVAVASDAVLPVAALTRRCASDPMPARVVDGTELDRFVGTARPVTDAEAVASPEPPPGVFSR